MTLSLKLGATCCLNGENYRRDNRVGETVKGRTIESSPNATTSMNCGVRGVFGAGIKAAFILLRKAKRIFLGSRAVIVVVIFRAMMASDRRVDIPLFVRRCIASLLCSGALLSCVVCFSFLDSFLCLSPVDGARSPEMKSPLHVLATGTCRRVTSAPAERPLFSLPRDSTCVYAEMIFRASAALSVDAVPVICALSPRLFRSAC